MTAPSHDLTERRVSLLICRCEETDRRTDVLHGNTEYLKLISMSLGFVPHVAAAEFCWRFKTIENFTSVVQQRLASLC